MSGRSKPILLLFWAVFPLLGWVLALHQFDDLVVDSEGTPAWFYEPRAA